MSDELKTAKESNQNLPNDAVLVDLQKRVTLYAPASSRHHAPFEEVKVGVAIVDKFKSQGFTEEKPKPEQKKSGKE